MTFLTRFDRWDPFEELTTLRGRMDSLWSRMTTGDAAMMADWVPTSDVTESKDEITIKAELPGVAAKDVHVRIDNGILTIRGEREKEKEVDEKGIHRIERAYGSFMRSYALPQSVEPETIAATLDNGLLEVRMPKKAGAATRTIELEVKPGEVKPNELSPKEATPKEVQTKEVLETVGV